MVSEERTKMKKKIISIIIIAMLVMGCGYCFNRLMRHEKAQSLQIASLIGSVGEVKERLLKQQEYFNYDIRWSDDDFNFLAIGNSLTLIRSWERGICSTKPDNDYFGLINSYLRTDYSEVCSHRWNFSIWERAAERSSVLDLLNSFLSEKVDLIVIQLGENVLITSEADINRYEQDLGKLINCLRSKALKAQIVVVDDFWDESRSNIRKKVAKEKGCLFADLEEIRGRKEYQSKEGTECLMTDGTIKRVSREAETHPGDEGMKYIAEKIIELL